MDQLHAIQGAGGEDKQSTLTALMCPAGLL